MDIYKGLKESNLPTSLKKIALFASHWIFQGILYMDATERWFKILLELILFIIIFLPISLALGVVTGMIIGLILAHSLNFFFNGHFWVLWKSFGLTRIDTKELLDKMERLRRRVEDNNWPLAIAIVGSFSRGELHSQSDLDVRILRRPGLRAGILASWFALTERAWSFLKRFPLDIYVIDRMESFSKLRADEYPVVIHDPENLFEEISLF